MKARALPTLVLLGVLLGVPALQADPGNGPTTLGAESYLNVPPSSQGVDDLPSLTAVALRYTYKNDRKVVEVLRDEVGRPYLALADVADFFGVKWSYQPQPRRIELTRGQRKVVAVLSQPYALVEGNESLSLAPPEMVDGQVALEPEAAAELMRAVLNVQVIFIKEHSSLVAGGVTPDDVRREIAAEVGKGVPAEAPTPLAGTSTAPPPPDRVVQTVKAGYTKAYRVRRVVVDPGHGGRDGGAKGYSGKYVEKTATLDIGLRVAALLRQQPDLEVLMTRDRDKYITLQYRAEFANRHKADLFVSIHCNANKKRSAKGTETYVYSSRASGNAADAAMRENSGGDPIDFVFDDLLHGAYRNRSIFLAQKIDGRIQDRLGQRILRIEQAPFYVLARVGMPSVLVETAFITHKDEEQKLKDPEWRQKIAQAIADGILAYRDGVEDSLERR